jgi:hypothetical protein
VILRQKDVDSIAWSGVVGRGEQQGVEIVLRGEFVIKKLFLLLQQDADRIDPECDCIYRLHAARKCQCYWTADQRRRFQNRQRRGQI